MNSRTYMLIAATAIMFSVIGGLSLLANYYTLSGIKSKTVGDGQHGVARFSTKKEIKETYEHIHFDVKAWRNGKHLPVD
ncbi:MAG TPA: conjugal transfer protein TraG, partial [Clostridiales bacterium]|nr:conjugal transfer protein TraG [Clostridiales bacterium]